MRAFQDIRNTLWCQTHVPVSSSLRDVSGDLNRCGRITACTSVNVAAKRFPRRMKANTIEVGLKIIPRALRISTWCLAKKCLGQHRFVNGATGDTVSRTDFAASLRVTAVATRVPPLAEDNRASSVQCSLFKSKRTALD